MAKKFEVNIPLILTIIIFFTGYGLYNYLQKDKISFSSPEELSIECAYNILDALYNDNNKAYDKVVDYCYNLEYYLPYGIGKDDIIGGLQILYQDYLEGEKYSHEIQRNLIKIEEKNENDEGLEYHITYKYNDINFETSFHLTYHENRWHLVYQ